MPPAEEPSSSPSSGAESDRDASLLAGAWSGLETDLAAERGMSGRLKRLSTPARRALAIAVGAALPATVLVLAPRDDLSSLTTERAIVWAAALLPLGTLGAVVATRSLTDRAIEGSRTMALAAAVLLALGVLVLVPLGAGGPTDPEGHGPIPCGSLALVVGAVTFALVHTMRRDAIGSRVGVAAVSACAAFAAAAFMCPIDALSHVSLGHALPAALLVLAGLALDRRRVEARATLVD
jgi:hypothetical protein